MYSLSSSKKKNKYTFKHNSTILYFPFSITNKKGDVSRDPLKQISRFDLAIENKLPRVFVVEKRYLAEGPNR